LAQTPAPPQSIQASPLSPADAALVRRAEDYLQALKAAEGRFTQIDAKGRLTAGTFAFERPGRARFAYDGAKGLLVVSDGDAVSVYDRRMKSFDQYPLEQTPLVLLLGDKVRLESALTVTKVTRTFGGFVFEARDARGRAPGRLALAFSLSPLALTGWSIVDAQNQKTSVRLTRLERRARLPANLFVLKDPAADATP
jgi:outer membrane lipoprotein-sorting protein